MASNRTALWRNVDARPRKRSGADNASALTECYRFGGIAFESAALTSTKQSTPLGLSATRSSFAQMGLHRAAENPVEFTGKPQRGDDFAAAAMGFRRLAPEFSALPIKAPIIVALPLQDERPAIDGATGGSVKSATSAEALLSGMKGSIWASRASSARCRELSAAGGPMTSVISPLGGAESR